MYNHNTSKTPICVHCSAGIGRTGVFIAIHSQYRVYKYLVKNGKKDEYQYDILSLIRNLRSKRFGLVQTIEQFTFIKDALNTIVNGDVNIE